MYAVTCAYPLQVVVPLCTLFQVALLNFKAQSLNIQRYTKVATTIQNTVQCDHITGREKEKNKSYYPDITESFFQEGR